MTKIQYIFLCTLLIIGMIMLGIATVIALGNILHIFPDPNPILFGGLLFGGTGLTLPLPIAQAVTCRRIRRACGL